jgi:hypothetical protein
MICSSVKRWPRMGGPPGRHRSRQTLIRNGPVFGGQVIHPMTPQVGQDRPRLVVVDEFVLTTAIDPYLSLKALSSSSGLSVRTLRSFIERLPDEALPCYRLPGKILVRRSDFDTWIAQYHARGRPTLTHALQDLGLSP